MSRQVEDREVPVSQIDHIALREMARRMGGGDPVAVERKAFAGQGIDEHGVVAVETVTGQALPQHRRKPRRGKRREFPVILHARRLDLMHEPRLEFVERAHMIIVDMGSDRSERFVRQVGDGVLERGDAGSGVDQKIAVAPAHEPDIAANEGMDMRLVEERHAVSHFLSLEPALGDFHVNGSGLRQRTPVGSPGTRGEQHSSEKASLDRGTPAPQKINAPRPTRQSESIAPDTTGTARLNRRRVHGRMAESRAA